MVLRLWIHHAVKTSSLMKRIIIGKICFLFLLACGEVYGGTRTFEFDYRVSIPAVPQGKGPMHVFIPLAAGDERQTIKSRRISVTPDLKWGIGAERVYGNSFLHISRQTSNGAAIEILIRYLVERGEFSADVSKWNGASYSDLEKRRYALFLAANRRVPVDGDVIGPIARDIAPGEKALPVIARTIYDYVIDNMEYKKVGSGWGNGDTFWACSEKYGNCTDFHALFISLARNRGIPARFSIGFPVPPDKPEGTIDGYHCWVDFYLPHAGWVPIDASEAWKHPQQRDLYFGTHPADRIHFTTGRDLELGEGHTTGPLNYFIYPHVEAGGKLFDGFKVQFRYREVGDLGKEKVLPTRTPG